MARASTVAVVVPSPALSEVLLATSFTIWAPMFSNLFSRSISLATVTPSLVTVGEPKDFSMTTLRPLGPRVTATASGAPWWKKISLAAIVANLRKTSVFGMGPGLALPGCERQPKGLPAVVNANVRGQGPGLHAGASPAAEIDGVAKRLPAPGDRP